VCVCVCVYVCLYNIVQYAPLNVNSLQKNHLALYADTDSSFCFLKSSLLFLKQGNVVKSETLLCVKQFKSNGSKFIFSFALHYNCSFRDRRIIKCTAFATRCVKKNHPVYDFVNLNEIVFI
jgi:hypothetical protein